MLARASRDMGTSELLQVVRARERGEVRGIWSVCSAHPAAIEAAVEQVLEDGSVLLVESTANQVNQDGGYTGMRPADFAGLVERVAGETGLARKRLILGGDHLGPLPFRARGVEQAMAAAGDLVAACVRAGYTKLHLDASMALAGDAGPPSAEQVTERAADLLVRAEETHARLVGGAPAPLYVIGTDVPPAGGDVGETRAPAATTAEEAARTVELFRAALARRGRESAWERVAAVVVQPGVSFGEHAVHSYDRTRTSALTALLRDSGGWVYEAHSTDYQTPEALRAMVEDGFAILTVGPALTFAFREAVFALEAIERELLGPCGGALSDLRGVLGDVMRADPRYWQGRDETRPPDAWTRRGFGYLDRARYYWMRPEAQRALARLESNLDRRPLPLALLEKHLPGQAAAVRAGAVPGQPRALVRHRIREVTAAYARACRPAAAPAG